LRALKNSFRSLDYADFKKGYADVSIFQYVSNLCNRSIIGVIRDFRTFSEISFWLSDKGAMSYLMKLGDRIWKG
jgi:hypothetical protein